MGRWYGPQSGECTCCAFTPCPGGINRSGVRFVVDGFEDLDDSDLGGNDSTCLREYSVLNGTYEFPVIEEEWTEFIPHSQVFSHEVEVPVSEGSSSATTCGGPPNASRCGWRLLFVISGALTCASHENFDNVLTVQATVRLELRHPITDFLWDSWAFITSQIVFQNTSYNNKAFAGECFGGDFLVVDEQLADLDVEFFL